MTMRLTQHDIKHLELLWASHKQNKRKLRFIEFELLNPHKEVEEVSEIRSGGISKPTENKVITLMENKQYRNLKELIDAIELLYKKASDTEKRIIDMRYWNSEGLPCSWEEIADELYMTRFQLNRKKVKLMMDTAESIGYISHN